MSNNLSSEILKTPECIECFENINTHANYVFGMFEVNSAKVMAVKLVQFAFLIVASSYGVYQVIFLITKI